MVCSKLSGRFLKVRAKVSGFVIAKVEKRNTPEQVIVTKKRNTILPTALPNLLNAFQTYMSGVTYSGQNAPSSGIILTTPSGQQITLSFPSSPTISATSNSAILSFTVRDITVSSYTATSEELITTSAGYNIPIATASLSVTKNSDEILTITWVITISISTSGDISYIPTPTPQEGGAGACAGCGSGCLYCANSSANSEFPNGCSTCTPVGITSQYSQENVVTTQLFTDMFYNTYSAGSSNLFTQVTGTTLIIYILYCSAYFVAGAGAGTGDFVSYNPNYEGYPMTCYTADTVANPAYLQVYMPTETATYMGVQVEYTT